MKFNLVLCFGFLKKQYFLSRVLKNLYPDDFIHDIVPCNRGVYIILKENAYLDSTKDSLQTFYKKIVNNEKIDKIHPKIQIDRKKEK